MPKRGERRERVKLPLEDQPGSLAHWARQYEKWCRSRGQSERTVQNVRSYLEKVEDEPEAEPTEDDLHAALDAEGQADPEE